jgi:hypothetical protein
MMRELKYVGAKPRVSQKGVSFDSSKPDSYTFLSAAAELLESIDFNPQEGKSIYLHDIPPKNYSGKELVAFLESHCDDVDTIFDAGQEDTEKLIREHRKKVEENSHLSPDEKRAWLGNIDIMHDYYQQYMTNHRAYKCILNVLADKIHENHIEYITVPLGRNYGLVFGDLAEVLQDHKPPYDVSMRIEEKHGMGYATLDINRPKSVSF